VANPQGCIYSWALLWDFVVITIFVIAAAVILFGKKWIRIVIAGPVFLAGSAIILSLDTFFPFDTLGPLQYFVPYLVETNVWLINVLELGIATGRDNIMFLRGDHGPFVLQVFWPSAGVHSIIIYSLVMMAFLLKMNIQRNRKALYFGLGIIGTIIINLIRIFSLSVFALKVSTNPVEFEALLAAIFVLPSGLIRALGGWFSDRFGAYKVTWWVMWISLICLFFMSYPQTEMTISSLKGDYTVHAGPNVWTFTALLFTLGIAWGFGKASVFKFLSDEYYDDIGVASGIVGLAGGMGGFLLPIMFGAMIDITGVNSTVFMLLFGATAVSLIWMHFTFSKDQREKGELAIKDRAYSNCVDLQENPAEYVAARAAVEQAGLLEELVSKYAAARIKAEREARQLKNAPKAAATKVQADAPKVKPAVSEPVTRKAKPNVSKPDAAKPE
jgi:exosortase/archaeosortase family protein